MFKVGTQYRLIHSKINLFECILVYDDDKKAIMRSKHSDADVIFHIKELGTVIEEHDTIDEEYLFYTHIGSDTIQVMKNTFGQAGLNSFNIDNVSRIVVTFKDKKAIGVRLK